MPDVEKFWSAFKFSWVRRLITSDSYWPNIIIAQVSQLLGQQITPCQLFELGPAKLCNLSKSLKNKFWAQVLQSTVPIIEGEIFCRPEKLPLSPVWHNPMIRRNNKVLRPEDFPEISSKISTLSSFYYPGTNKFMELQDFRDKYCDNFCNLRFIDLRYCISLALQKMNFPTSKLIDVHYPMKPLLIDVALSTTKGCSKYYRILMRSKMLKNKLHIREDKWHTELQALHSIDFWDKTRKLYSSISFNNNLKWLQFQIVRNSLQTNYIVSHFIRNVSPECKFCGLVDEKISHLFWSCNIVNEFLGEVFEYICSTGLDYRPSKIQFLFGFLDCNFEHPKNYLTLIIKKFIWQSKFKNAILTMGGLKGYLVICLNDLLMIYKLKGKPTNFSVWNNLYLDLCSSSNATSPIQASQTGLLNLLVPAAQPRDTNCSLPPPLLCQASQDPTGG